jgi:hypothetical protein
VSPDPAQSISMNDYLCMTVWSLAGENESGFKMRLAAFWTHLLRNHPAEFEKVYAETSAFEQEGDRLSRKYLVEAAAATAVEEMLREKGIDVEPIDPDERYSKYEAAPPEWYWIEH